MIKYMQEQKIDLLIPENKIKKTAFKEPGEYFDTN